MPNHLEPRAKLATRDDHIHDIGETKVRAGAKPNEACRRSFFTSCKQLLDASSCYRNGSNDVLVKLFGRKRDSQNPKSDAHS